MPLTSIVACQIFAIADVPGRREELPPSATVQAFVSLIFDGGFMNNTDVGQFGNLSKRTAGLEVLAEGRLTRNLHWDLRLEQRFDEYDFCRHRCVDGGNPNNPAGDDFDTSDQPWRNVYTTTFALEFSRSKVPTPPLVVSVCKRLVSVLQDGVTGAPSLGTGASPLDTAMILHLAGDSRFVNKSMVPPSSSQSWPWIGR